ncbi:MAG: prolyl oligopeptidase family serine peptidase, partial [Pseudomonadota bacterium]
MADHAAALKNVGASRRYMDMDRVGVDGNSWGGYMATRALIDAPDLYKAAAASVPETDLLDHIHWIEFQLGAPQDNMAAYLKNGTPALADKINAPLMIVSGTADANVPISNTMKLIDALADAGKQYDLVLFPGTNHPHQGRGDRYAYAVNRIGLFFAEHLGGPERR